MKTKEAILYTARSFARSGNFRPSHCEVRLMLNDLIDNQEYAQNHAVKRVWKLLADAGRLEGAL